MEKEPKKVEIKLSTLIISIIVIIVIFAIGNLGYVNFQKGNKVESNNEEIQDVEIEENNVENDIDKNIIKENRPDENIVEVNKTINNVNTNNTESKKDTVKENTTKENNISITFEEKNDVRKIDNSEYTITAKQTYCKVSATDKNVEKKLQTKLDEISDKNFNEFKSQIENIEFTSDDMELTGNLEISNAFSKSRIDENVVSLCNVTDGGLGGASWYSKSGLSFNSKTGEILKIDDIAINKSKFINFVDTTINNEILSDKEKYYIYDDTTQIESITNLNWYLSEEGLTIAFSKYQISPNTFEYTISYSKLANYIKNEYMY